MTCGGCQSRVRGLVSRRVNKLADAILDGTPHRHLTLVEERLWVLSWPIGIGAYDLELERYFACRHPVYPPEHLRCIARLGPFADYPAVHEGLRAQGIALIHTPDEHLRADDLRAWYPSCPGHQTLPRERPRGGRAIPLSAVLTAGDPWSAPGTWAMRWSARTALARSRRPDVVPGTSTSALPWAPPRASLSRGCSLPDQEWTGVLPPEEKKTRSRAQAQTEPARTAAPGS